MSDASVVVSIRPYEAADAVSIAEAVRESTGDAHRWLPWCHPGYSIEDARTWIDAQMPAFRHKAEFAFAIVSAEGRYLGGCGLSRLDAVNRRGNIGYWVRSSATRSGVATAAVERVHEWAFQHTELVRLEIVVAVDNVGSRRVAEKAGAVYEGILRKRLLLHGVHHDAAMYSIVR